MSGNLSKSAFFEGGGSLSANISGGRGQFPATSVAVERLEISLFRGGVEILTDDYFVLSQ